MKGERFACACIFTNDFACSLPTTLHVHVNVLEEEDEEEEEESKEGEGDSCFIP